MISLDLVVSLTLTSYCQLLEGGASSRGLFTKKFLLNYMTKTSITQFFFLLATFKLAGSYVFPQYIFHSKKCLNAANLGFNIDELNLTPKLKQYAEMFKNVDDEKLRYQQLLYFASKMDPMPAEYKIPENKVPGCLSTVFVHAYSEDQKVYFRGDSDGQLTKGLLALLVNGLSGNSAEDISKVRPEFIQYAGISASLTPGRNSGFLNMLGMMKSKASNLGAESSNLGDSEIALDGPIARSIAKKLSLLKPISLQIVNDSQKHAGHSGMNGIDSNESHFTVAIVADCFQGLSLVQRHKMIYTLLDSELKGGGVHALSINAKTSEEVQNAGVK